MDSNSPLVPHVLVFPFPAQGHVNGAMDISRKLALLGVSITFVCTEPYISSLLKHGFHANGLPIRLLSLPDEEKPAAMADRLDQISVVLEATENMGPALESLLIKLGEECRPVTCVLYDFMLWWIGGLGKKLNIPAYIFYAMSASFFSYLIHIPGFVSEGRLPLGSGTDLSDESIVFKIPGFPPLHAREVPDISWSPNPLCSFAYTLRSTKTWQDATGILFNTVYELEKEVIDDLRRQAPEMDIRAVGPILPLSFLRKEMGDEAKHEGGAGESAEISSLKWLDKQPSASVLYIAFGTIASFSRAQLHELAMGIEASKQKFLWVVRIPASSHNESSLQEIHGKEIHDKKFMPIDHRRDYLPKGFEERTQGRGMVLWEPAPQREILAHRAIGGFLTHCGWNSTLESLCRGVPMLCWPMLGDQGMNSKIIGDMLRIGRPLIKMGKDNDGFVCREEVESGIKELMDMSPHNKEGLLLRVRASQFQDMASEVAFSGGSSYRDLHGFIQVLAHMAQAQSL